MAFEPENDCRLVRNFFRKWVEDDGFKEKRKFSKHAFGV